MPRLKLFKATSGFHDSYVATTSRAAALKAWGARTDLFAMGAAEPVEPVAPAAPPAEPVPQPTPAPAADPTSAAPAPAPATNGHARTPSTVSGTGIPDGRLAEAERDGRLGIVGSIRGRILDLGGTAELSTGRTGTEWELIVPRRGLEKVEQR